MSLSDRERAGAFEMFFLPSFLLARTAVAALSAVGTVGAESHHVLEHGLDVAMAGLVIAAVYDARAARRSADSTPSSDDSRGERP